MSARIGEIQSNADPSEWKHFPGEENVADDISRGIYVGDLNGRWSNGPEFLQKPEELWPQEVANLVNQRPIGRIPNHPDDGKYICPNDILLGRASSEVPQGPFKETQNPRHRVEFLQKIVDSFWKRWNRDVFPSLVPRKQWQIERRNVKVNDIVTVADSNAVRGKWCTGRIMEVYPGPDGRVRNVKVKTSTGVYSRPVTKVAVICPAEEE